MSWFNSSIILNSFNCAVCSFYKCTSWFLTRQILEPFSQCQLFDIHTQFLPWLHSSSPFRTFNKTPISFSLAVPRHHGVQCVPHGLRGGLWQCAAVAGWLVGCHGQRVVMYGHTHGGLFLSGGDGSASGSVRLTGEVQAVCGPSWTCIWG